MSIADQEWSYSTYLLMFYDKSRKQEGLLKELDQIMEKLTRYILSEKGTRQFPEFNSLTKESNELVEEYNSILKEMRQLQDVGERIKLIKELLQVAEERTEMTKDLLNTGERLLRSKTKITSSGSSSDDKSLQTG